MIIKQKNLSERANFKESVWFSTRKILWRFMNPKTATEMDYKIASKQENLHIVL